MELEKYNKENAHKGASRFVNRKSLMLIAFLLILAMIFVTAFYDGEGIGLAGNVIGYSFNENSSMDIKASLLSPDISINGAYEEITISMKRGSFIEFDGKKISLDGIDNTLTIKDFKGDISVGKNEIKEMNGKISEIKINNIPMSAQNNEKLSFLISNNAGFNSFEIKKGVYLKDLSFQTSGVIDLGVNSLSLNSEKLTLKNYLGGINIRDEKLFLQGAVEDIRIEGKTRKIIFSSI